MSRNTFPAPKRMPSHVSDSFKEQLVSFLWPDLQKHLLPAEHCELVQRGVSYLLVPAEFGTKHDVMVKHYLTYGHEKLTDSMDARVQRIWYAFLVYSSPSYHCGFLLVDYLYRTGVLFVGTDTQRIRSIRQELTHELEWLQKKHFELAELAS